MKTTYLVRFLAAAVPLSILAACSAAPSDPTESSGDALMSVGGLGSSGGVFAPPDPPPPVVWPPAHPQYCPTVDPYCMITGTSPTPAAHVAAGCAATAIDFFTAVPSEKGERLVLCPSSVSFPKHLGLCDKCAPVAPSGQVYVILQGGLVTSGPCESGCPRGDRPPSREGRI